MKRNRLKGKRWLAFAFATILVLNTMAVYAQDSITEPVKSVTEETVEDADAVELTNIETESIIEEANVSTSGNEDLEENKEEETVEEETVETDLILDTVPDAETGKQDEIPVEITEESEETDSYTVTFYASEIIDEELQEYELATIEVIADTAIEANDIPKVPEIEKYTFVGWDNDITAEIIDDTEFHAIYEIIEEAEEEEKIEEEAEEEEEIEVSVSEISADDLVNVEELVQLSYEAYEIADSFDLSVPDDTEYPVTITFPSNVNAQDEILLLHNNSEEWEEIIPDEVADGEITATFTSLSPVVVLKYADKEDNEENEDVEVTVSEISAEDLASAEELVKNDYAGQEIVDSFDLSVPEETTFPVTVTFAANVTPQDQILLLHYTGSEWEEIIPDEVMDGSIKATFTSLSPVVVLRQADTELELVEKRLTKEINGIRINVMGEMPESAYLDVSQITPSEREIDGKVAIASYDIKILYAGGIEYEPVDHDKNVRVTFSNISKLVLGEVAVQHNTEEGFVEMESKEVTENNDTISFETDSFSEYILTTATLTMTKGADYVSIPIVGKTGYIYHMKLDGYTAFCIELGKKASSNDQYYYTEVFSNANALKVLDVFENKSSLSYETAQALVWLAIEGDFTDANITTVLQSLQCTDSNIRTVLSDLSTATGANTWYVYTSIKGSEYQKVITTFQLIQNEVDMDTVNNSIFFKVFLDGVATDAYPLTMKTCKNTWVSNIGGKSVDGEITPISLGNGLYEVTYEQLENANMIYKNPIIYSSESGDVYCLAGKFGANIAGKTIGYKGSDGGFGSVLNSDDNSEQVQAMLSTTIGYNEPLQAPKEGIYVTEENESYFPMYRNDNNIKTYTTNVFVIYLSTIKVKDYETDETLLDGGVVLRTLYNGSQNYTTSYYVLNATQYTGTQKDSAIDLGIDISSLSSRAKSIINQGNIGYPYKLSTNKYKDGAYIYDVSNRGYASPIIHYITNSGLTMHTVTFDVNGGNPEYGSVDVRDGEKVAKPLTVPLKNGSKFVSWQLNGTDYDFNKPVTQDITLVAKYSTVGYNITYDLDGGEMPAGVTNPTYYNIDTPTFTLNNPVKTGYTFKGWTGSNGTTPQTTVIVSKGTTGDLSYKANWEIKRYTVKFEDDSTVKNYRSDTKFPKSVSVDHGSAVAYPADWVSYYNNGNNFDVVNSHNYYKFIGWKNKDTGEYIPEADLANPSATGITSNRYAVTGNVTYVAMYDTLHEVVFTDGVNKIAPATIASPDNVTLKDGSYYYKEGAIIDQPGSSYSAAYWAKGNLPEDISTIRADIPLNLTKYGNSITMGSNAVSYIAYYSMSFYNDDYVDNANRGTLVSSIYNVAGGIVAPPEGPTTTTGASHQIFDKWKLVEAGDINATPFVQQNSSMVYVATYKTAPTYTVKFVDYDDTLINQHTYFMSETISVPASPEREGYVFKNWTPTVNNVCTGNATYKAVYAELFTIKFVDHDGTVISEKKYANGDSIVVPPSPTREGYSFNKWAPIVNMVCNGNATYMAEYKVELPPTPVPTQEPTPEPTEEPVEEPEPTEEPVPTAAPTITPAPATPVPTQEPTPEPTEEPIEEPEPTEEPVPTVAPTYVPESTPTIAPVAVTVEKKTAELTPELTKETAHKYELDKFIAAVIGIAAATGVSLWGLLMLLLFLFRRKNKVIGMYETDGKVTYVNGNGRKIKASDLEDVQTVQELAEKVNRGEMSVEEFLDQLYEYDVWTVFPPKTIAEVAIGESSLSMPKFNNQEVTHTFENVSGETTIHISNPDKNVDVEFTLK